MTTKINGILAAALLAGSMAAALSACENDDTTDFSTYIEGAHTGTAGDTIYIVYNGNTATVTGDTSSTVTVSGADVTVNSTSAGYQVYVLSGSAPDGSLLVYSQKKYGIVLNGLSLTNADGPAINNQCGKSLFLTCADGTTNTLADGTTYADAPTNASGESIDQKGALFSEGQIFFGGKGTLSVTGNAKNAIASDDYIVLEEDGPTINVTANATNGIKVNDGMKILGGVLDITVNADGGRGIKNSSYMTISGGTTTITTNGNCLIENVDGVPDTTSCAGIKCDSLFLMTAGTLAIASTGDGGKGINCADSVVFRGGSLTAATTGGNTHAKPKAVKGSLGIYVSGGTFQATCTKSWACDNGSESEDPKQRVTVIGSPAEETLVLKKRQVFISFE